MNRTTSSAVQCQLDGLTEMLTRTHWQSGTAPVAQLQTVFVASCVQIGLFMNAAYKQRQLLLCQSTLVTSVSSILQAD